MQIVRYNPNQHAALWEQVVEASANGTFLFSRQFMDYHADRFTDCSWIFLKDDKPIAVFPANYVAEQQAVVSHGGLTYGGLISLPSATSADVLECYELLLAQLRLLGAKQLDVRPTPYIYYSYPAEAQLYALFRHGATLSARGLSAAFPLRQPLPFKKDRRAGVHKAERIGLNVVQTAEEQHIRQFHALLCQCLADGHGVKPVHSADEMVLLQGRFPRNIQLYLAQTPQGEIMAGTWLFLTPNVVHTQYMAATSAGKAHGALDTIIHHLRQQPFPQTYFDFGISTEDHGHYLNAGLAYQKEGFGARPVCYDAWRLPL